MSELLANMPDPTQDEVRGEGENREKRSDHSSTGEDLADLTVNTSETELLSDIFGLDLRREGGQYKITPHNPNASFTELLNSPVPLPTPSTAPQPEVRWRHQVISFFLYDIPVFNKSEYPGIDVSASLQSAVNLPYLLLK